MIKKFNYFLNEGYEVLVHNDDKRDFVNFLETELKEKDLSRFWIDIFDWHETKEDFDNKKNTRVMIKIVFYNIKNLSFNEYFYNLEIIKNYFQEFDLDIQMKTEKEKQTLSFFYNDKLKEFYENTEYYHDIKKSRNIKKFKI